MLPGITMRDVYSDILYTFFIGSFIGFIFGLIWALVLDLMHERSFDRSMGSRGFGDVEEFLLGSVSHGVVNKAECPVLIVK